MLVYRVPWTSQPPVHERRLRNVDQTFAFSRGKIFRSLQRSGTAIAPTHEATPSRPTTAGIASLLNGTSQYWRTHGTLPSSPTAGTLLAIVIPNLADSTERTVLSLSNTADTTPLFRLDANPSNTWRFQVRANDGSIAQIDGSTAVAAGTLAVLGGVYRTGSGERSLWVNGTKQGTDTTSGVGGPITLNVTTVGALERTTVSQYFSGDIIEAHILPFALGDVEMRDITWNPQTFFRYVYAPRRLWVPEAAAGGGFQVAWARNANILISTGARTL